MSVVCCLSLLAVLGQVKDGQAVPAKPVVKVGDVVKGEVTKDSPVVDTPTLDKNYTDAPTRGVTYQLVVEQPGPVTIELRSYFFDAYLVVRDAKGELVAEDDDGLLRTHARVLMKSEVAATFEIEACALHGGTGPFELRVAAGATPLLDARSKKDAELEDARREVEVVEKLRGSEHADTARSRNNLALLLYKKGKYEEARALFEEVLATYLKTIGPDDFKTAQCRNDLGTMFWRMGDSARALREFELALPVFEKTLGPDDVRTAVCLSNLGLQLLSVGRLADARACFERALHIYELKLGDRHPKTTWAINNLAQTLKAEGNLVAARSLYERALRIFTDVYGSAAPMAAEGMSNLACVLLEQGAYSEARPLLERALGIFRKGLGSEHEITAACMHNLALLLSLQGHAGEARPLMQEALRIREKVCGPDHPDTAMSRNNLAIMLERDGDAPSARVLYEEALKTCVQRRGEQHADTARCRKNLADVLAHVGQSDAALEQYELALQAFESSLGVEHADTARCSSSLAHLLAREGKRGEARTCYERAIAAFDKVLGPGHPDSAWSMGEFARFLLDGRELDDARKLIARLVEGTSAYALQQSREAPADELFAIVGQRESALSLLLSISRGDVGGGIADAYTEVMSFKGSVLRELASRRDALGASLDAPLRAKLDLLRSSRAACSNLMSIQEVKDSGRHDEDIVQLRKQRVLLESDVAQAVVARPELRTATFEQLRAALPSNTVVLDFLEHRLYEPGSTNEGASAKQGRWGPLRMSAWLTRADRDRAVWVDLGPTDRLDAAIRKFLESFEPNRGAGLVAPLVDTSSSDAAAAALRKLLWDPLKPFIGDATNLLISADGALGLLPFGVVVDDDGHHLVERFTISNIDDVSVLTRPHRPRAAELESSPSFLVAGAVDYDAADAAPTADAPNRDLRGAFTSAWVPLNATSVEAAGVARLHKRRFKDAACLELRGSEPTEERLKLELPKHSIIHLATHGYFLADGVRSLTEVLNDPEERARLDTPEHRLVAAYFPSLLCGVVCAGANAPPPGRDNGLLTGEEVSGLDLESCDLVVLSACETALGRPGSAGQGSLSLARAFREAGARTVISSLWQVRDDSTKDLILDFYDRLWNQHESKLDALRDAQLDMLRKNREKYGDTRPATWGAFVLTGETE